MNINFVDNLNQFINPNIAMSTNDDMEMLSKELLASKIVIFSTPVYFKSVSAGMKIFLDRLVGWTHTFELTGRYGVIIVCGSQNGSEETVKFLEDFMIRLGLGTIQVIEYNSNEDSEESLRKRIEMISDNLSIRIKENLAPEPTEIQKKIYSDYRRVFLSENINPIEHEIWLEKTKENHNLAELFKLNYHKL